MITVWNHQSRVPVPLRWLRRFATLALAECLPHSGDGAFALRDLEEVEVSIVSDRRIARVHQDFMQIPGATDVITFEHGEIVLSADTACAQAKVFGHAAREEMALYIVHGLLHLNGYDDRTVPDRRRMHRLQARVMKACLARLSAG